VRALLKRILQDEGFAGFYRGFGATMLNTFSMRTSFFFAPLSLPFPPSQPNVPQQNTPISSSTPSSARRT
jgi:hypothetical protein